LEVDAMAGWIILGLVAVFLGVILVRAALFNPKPQKESEVAAIRFDRDAAVHALAQLVQCRTVSHVDHEKEDEAEFARRREEAKANPKEVNIEELTQRMLDELNLIPVGQGQRHSAAKRILTKYAHLGLADVLCTVPCPWPDKKWQREWDSLISWVEQNVKII
jgi:hypothetical protein